jgi:hypothetical protein
MKRRFQGLRQADQSSTGELPDGLYLTQVAKAQYRWHAQKPYYQVRFIVVEPQTLAGRNFSGRLYCTSKALWRLTWFLRDFGYDAELLGQDEVEDKNLAGLRGVVKISHAVVNGTTLLNLDAFAPASRWDEFALASTAQANGPEAA